MGDMEEIYDKEVLQANLELIENMTVGEIRKTLPDDGAFMIYGNSHWAVLKRNMTDQVNHPAHYQKNGRECIDVMIEKFGTEAVINFCECNQFKYEWRAGLKEGNSAETDRAKAAWYKKKAEELKDANH